MNPTARDMKWMMFGEIGALLLSGASGAVAFVALDDFRLPARIILAIVTMYFVGQNALRFVNWKHRAGRRT